MVAKLIDSEGGTFWDRVLDRVEHALNNTMNRSMGQWPSVMVFDIGQRDKVGYSLREYLVHSHG